MNIARILLLAATAPPEHSRQLCARQFNIKNVIAWLLACLLACLLTYSLTYLLTYLFARWLAYLLACSKMRFAEFFDVQADRTLMELDNAMQRKWNQVLTMQRK